MNYITCRGRLKLSGIIRTMENNLYSDKLIEISERTILIRKYFYPFGSRRVNVTDIETITVDKPGLSSGKFRYWGTGDFRTWYPPDNRAIRDKIFVMKLKNKWWRIGFTVEDSEKVIDLLNSHCPLIDNSGT